MPDPQPPKPDQPAGAPAPNAPKDPAVYGGEWGGDGKGGGAEPAGGSPPPDRPDRLKPPAESE